MDKIDGDNLLFSTKTGVAASASTSTNDIKKIHYIWIGGELKIEYINALSAMVKLCQIKSIELCLWTDNTSRINNVLELKNLSSNGVTIKNTEDLISELINNNKAFGLDDKSREYILKTVLFEYAVAPNYATIADIFRLMILFLEGGLYLDIDLRLIYTFELNNQKHFNTEYTYQNAKYERITENDEAKAKAEAAASARNLEQLNEFKTLVSDDSKKDWIIAKFTNFLEKMGSGYPIGARDTCNDIIISQPAHPELTAILENIASIIIKKKEDANYLANKKYLLKHGLFYKYTLNLGPNAVWFRDTTMLNILSMSVCSEFLVIKHDNNWILSCFSPDHNIEDKQISQNIETLQKNIFNQSLEVLSEYIKLSEYTACDAAPKLLSDDAAPKLVSEKRSKSKPRYIA